MHSSRICTGRSLIVDRGGGCFLPGGCLLPGGVLPSWGVLPSQGGGGCLLPGGGVVVSQHALRQTHPPPPVNRISDTSKNITLATTSLRPVIIHYVIVKPSICANYNKPCMHISISTMPSKYTVLTLTLSHFPKL